jgi:ABC-2 type transport system permease protein
VINLNALLRLLIRDIRGSVGMSPYLVLSQLVSPLVYIFIAGFMYSGIVKGIEIDGVTVSYVLFLAPGIVVSQFMLGASYAGSMVWFDKRMGMLEQILAGPFSRAQYVTSKLLSVTMQGVANALLVFLIALPVLAGASLSPSGLPLVLGSLILGSLFFGSLMLAISTRIKSDQSLNMMFNTVFAPLMFLSSVFYPLDVAPPVLRILALCNPLTYSVDMIRAGLLGISTSYLPYEIVVLSAESIGMLLVAVHAFRGVKV